MLLDIESISLEPNESIVSRKIVTLRACREAQWPQGFQGTASGISLERRRKLEQSRREIVLLVARLHCSAVAVSDLREL